MSRLLAVLVVIGALSLQAREDTARFPLEGELLLGSRPHAILTGMRQDGMGEGEESLAEQESGLFVLMNFSSSEHEKGGLERPVLFVKTHSTGSSTMTSILHRYCDVHGVTCPVYPHSNINMKSPNKLRKTMKGADGHVAVWPNHVNLDQSTQPVFDEAMPGSFKFSIFREPSSRLFSALKHRDHAKGAKFLHQLMTDLKENKIVSTHTCGMGEVGMAQTKQVPLSMFDQLDFVALTERYDESLMLLRKELGWDMEDMLYLRMKNDGDREDDWKTEWQDFKQYLDRAETPAARDYVAECFEKEEQLYKKASIRFEKQVEKFGAEKLKEEVRQFRALNSAFLKCCEAHPEACKEASLDNLAWNAARSGDDTSPTFGCLKGAAKDSKLEVAQDSKLEVSLKHVEDMRDDDAHLGKHSKGTRGSVPVPAKAWYINMDASTDRRDAMEKAYRRTGIPYQRFSALAPSVDDLFSNDRYAFLKKWLDSCEGKHGKAICALARHHKSLLQTDLKNVTEKADAAPRVEPPELERRRARDGEAYTKQEFLSSGEERALADWDAAHVQMVTDNAGEPIHDMHAAEPPVQMAEMVEQTEDRPSEANIAAVIGCMVSKAAVLELIQKEGKPGEVYLIAEDDYTPAPDLAARLPALLETVPAGWDVLKMDAKGKSNRNPPASTDGRVRKLALWPEGSPKRGHEHRCGGTHALLVPFEKAGKLHALYTGKTSTGKAGDSSLASDCMLFRKDFNNYDANWGLFQSVKRLRYNSTIPGHNR